MFQECFKGVSRKFQENFQGVSKKFHVAWHSSQLPEQKEGLFVRGSASALAVLATVYNSVSPVNNDFVNSRTRFSR